MTSGTDEPKWVDKIGTKTKDGDVTWSNAGKLLQTCTVDNPAPPEHAEVWNHPDAEITGRDGNLQFYFCPICNTRFTGHLGPY